MKHPEAAYKVSITPEGTLECRTPDGVVERLRLSDARAIYVEANDSGPWGADVWWLVEGPSGRIEIAFPQLATGEDDVLEEFERLPGFEVKGMNSTSSARFECWRSSS